MENNEEDQKSPQIALRGSIWLIKSDFAD